MDRDRLTGPQARWLEHVEACSTSGMSMKAYAEANDLNLQSFYFWKGQLKKLGVLGPTTTAQHASTIVPVSVALSSQQCSAHVKLSNGIAIEVPGVIDAQALALLIKAALEAGQ